jgi:hypothetical protein
MRRVWEEYGESMGKTRETLGKGIGKTRERYGMSYTEKTLQVRMIILQELYSVLQ